MKISKTTAMKIVNDLSDTILQSINLMDEYGVIIASSDESRLGAHHAASQKILIDKLDSLIVFEDEEYVGAKKGINLPVEIDDKYVGVIGITGEYREVEKYGRIIKKMTEILILEDARKTNKRNEQTAKNSFISDWVLSENKIQDEQFFSNAAHYNIDINKKRKIVVMSLAEHKNFNSQQHIFQYEQHENAIRNVLFNEDNTLFFTNMQNYIILTPNLSDSSIKLLCENLQKAISKFGSHFHIGVDSDVANPQFMKSSYLKANKAKQTAIRNNTELPVLYSDLYLELFINDISKELKSEYVNKLYYGFTLQEVQNLCTILNTLYDCNGSLKKASERLFIHINTLQYKLNKIQTVTGVDPRSCHGIALFYIANEFLNT